MRASDACSTSSLAGMSTCKYGGTCVTTSEGNRCRCRWGDRGATCSKSAWTFKTLSYVEHSDVVVSGAFSVQFDVATVEQQALLLLASAGQRVFVSLELIAGRPRLSFRTSDGFVQRVDTPGTASDGLWHHVVANITNTVCNSACFAYCLASSCCHKTHKLFSMMIRVGR